LKIGVTADFPEYADKFDTSRPLSICEGLGPDCVEEDYPIFTLPVHADDNVILNLWMKVLIIVGICLMISLVIFTVIYKLRKKPTVTDSLFYMNEKLLLNGQTYNDYTRLS